MTTTERSLFDLLSIALGNKDVAEFQTLGMDGWRDVRALAEKHAVQGVVFGAVEKLPESKRPKDSLFILDWYGQVLQIEQRNIEINKTCSELTQLMLQVGLSCCVMKGQSMARLYPMPLRRVAGDIDALVNLPNAKCVSYKNIEEIRRRINSLGRGEVGHVVYHHSNWRLGDVEVELHHRPTYLNNPFRNRSLQNWGLKTQASNFKLQHLDEFFSPSLEFDLVYILLHIYHHLLFEGVGLRQVMDYAVVLQRAHSTNLVHNSSLRLKTLKTFDKLGLTRFARGLMWVLQVTCGVKKEELLLEADEQLGQFILKEVMPGGNMGQYDSRTTNKRRILKNRSLYRLRFLRYFPLEIIWDVPFRIWHKCWRAFGQIRFGWK